MSKAVAIHQPNYIPWTSYFLKAYLSDVFVFHDSVAFSKGTPTRRCGVLKPNSKNGESDFLALPIASGQEGMPIKDILLSDHFDWTTKHLALLQNTYRKAPFYKPVYEMIVPAMMALKNEKNMCVINAQLIKAIFSFLEIKCTTIFSSQMPALVGKNHALNLAILKQLDATIYVSGKGASSYQDEIELANNGIKVIYSDWKKFADANDFLKQNAPYSTGLSVIDTLFWIGKEQLIAFFEAYKINEIIGK